MAAIREGYYQGGPLAGTPAGPRGGQWSLYRNPDGTSRKPLQPSGRNRISYYYLSTSRDSGGDLVNVYKWRP